MRSRTSQLVGTVLALLLPLVWLVWPSPGAAQAPPVSAQFTITGRGWGHGVGMSQWGAKGLADRGWDEARILARYYQGTTLGTRPGPADGSRQNWIRVGLFQNASSQRVSGDGPFEFLSGETVVASSAGGQTWTVQVLPDGGLQLISPDGAPQGTFGGDLFVRFEPRGTVLSLPDQGHRYRYGLLQLSSHQVDRGYALRGVLGLDFERYLYGIAEVPSSWPAAALRAQAIAARTYALERATRLGQHRSWCDCAVYASTLDQVYVGYEKEAGPGGDRWRAAVDGTRGKVILYGDSPISANYFASSGGHTEDNDKQWGGSPLPYLRGVCDPGDYAGGQNPHSNWTVTMDEPTLRSRLAAGGYDVGVVQRIEYLDPRGVSGRVIGVISATEGGVRVVGTSGTARLSGSTFRSLLGLKSNLITPPLYGGIRERWDQLECAPGRPLSAEYDWRDLQGAWWGRAQDFQVGRLFWNARTSQVFWNYGGILEKFDELRRAGIDLGGPTSDELAVRGGRATFYERGHIYWSSQTGAHVTYGAILQRYLELGGPDSYLGLPLRDEEDVPGGRRSRFWNGSLVWNARTGAVLQLYGGILGRWETLGGAPGQPRNEEYDWVEVGGRWRGRAQDFDVGRLFWNARTSQVFWNYGGILEKFDELRRAGFEPGMPKSDEVGVRGGRAVSYELSRIYWSPQTGAHVVYGAILDKYLGTGGPDGRLGLPTSDEYSWNGVRRSDFQGGYITWDPSNGARVTLTS